MDSVFLTGATGFVGANLARLLIAKGYSVRALARRGGNRANLKGLALEIIDGDLSEKSAIEAGCKDARYAFHVAADYRLWVRNPEEMYAANVQGTENVVAAAKKARCEKIVVCSSVAAVRPPYGRTPSDESSQYSSVDEIISVYKKSKFLGEQVALKHALSGAPVVVVNPAAPIGAYDIKPTPTGKIVVDFLKGNLPSYIDTGLNVVHVEDVAQGHLLAALKGRIGQRYILGGENITLKAMLDILSQATGVPGPRFKTPYSIAYLFGALDTARACVFGGEPIAPLEAVKMARHYMWFDSSKAARELGYQFRPAREALVQAAAWFQANGYVPRAMEARAC